MLTWDTTTATWWVWYNRNSTTTTVGCGWNFAESRRFTGRNESDCEPAGVINLSQSFDWVHQWVTFIGIASLGMGHVIVVSEHGRINVSSSPCTHRKGRRTSNHQELEGNLYFFRI